MLFLDRPCVRDLENGNETGVGATTEAKRIYDDFEVSTTGLKGRKLAILERKQTDRGFVPQKRDQLYD